MTRREELLALAERVEALEGPDREVNKALAPLAGLRLVEEGPPLGLCCYDENGHGVPLPNFTASLDAAMSLVPKGWSVDIIRTADSRLGGAYLYLFGNSGSIPSKKVHGSAATPALALTAAALRALAESGQ